MGIGFVGRYGDDLHDQIDNYFISLGKGDPVTYLFDTIDDSIGLATEILQLHPKTRICLHSDKNRLEELLEIKFQIRARIGQGSINF